MLMAYHFGLYQELQKQPVKLIYCPENIKIHQRDVTYHTYRTNDTSSATLL